MISFMTMYDFVLYTTVSAISLYLFSMFFSVFFEKHVSKTKSVLAYLVAEAVFVTAAIGFPEKIIIKVLAGVIAAAIVSSLYSMKWYYHIVMSLAIYAMQCICEYTSLSFIVVLFEYNRKHFGQYDYNTIVLFFSCFIFYVLMSAIRFAKQRFAKSQLHRSLLFLLAAPALSISIILIQYRYVTDTEEVHLALSSMSLICFSVLIVYNILIFDWIGYVKSGVERDTKLAAAKELIAVQSQQYLETMEHHRQVYQIKHDQKHFLIGILSELENENYAEIKQVITSELELVSGDCELDLSKGIISTIIEQKCKLASAKGITVDTDLYGIESIKISPVELSILLGNALDNAIEATEKLTSSQSKQITLLIKAKKGTVLISIENPTEQDVDVSDLRSTKEGPEMHGFGLLSIKNIVEKHNGELLFSCEDGWFKTTMIIRNNEYPEESTMEQPQEMPYFKEDK